MTIHFFNPKILSREERVEKEKWKKRKKMFFQKTKLGLQNIKENYENKKWDSKGEELFLELFLKFHLKKEYNCFFDLKNDVIWVSGEHIWLIFRKEFHWSYYEIQSFMEDMFKKYFKLYDFTPSDFYSDHMEEFKEYFELYEFIASGL